MLASRLSGSKRLYLAHVRTDPALTNVKETWTARGNTAASSVKRIATKEAASPSPPGAVASFFGILGVSGRHFPPGHGRRGAGSSFAVSLGKGLRPNNMADNISQQILSSSRRGHVGSLAAFLTGFDGW